MNLDDFITKKLLKDGKNSKCYLLQTGEVFKQFKPAISPNDVEKFKYFLNYKNESFFFPFEFLCDGKKFYGYISKRALGKTLSESFSTPTGIPVTPLLESEQYEILTTSGSTGILGAPCLYLSVNSFIFSKTKLLSSSLAAGIAVWNSYI